ncbi:MAG: hypothetical protein ACXVPY_11160, partial [Bacteroidia bacterium]
MDTLHTDQPEKIVSTVTAKQLKSYLVSKGYGICNITPITNSRQWFAILTKNKEYIIGTIFTSDKGIERV